MKLSLEIIRSFCLKEKAIKPDWDDAGFEFTLPCGIILTGYCMLNSEPCKTDSLEGLDGFIYITTKEELEELYHLRYKELLLIIKEKNPKFKIEEYI